MTETAAELVDLMIRYQKADSEATVALISAVSPLLYRFLASQMGSRSDAEDLLQDVWLKIHSARHTYRPGEPVLPWFYAIARHVRIDNYRKRRRLAQRETAMESPPEPLVRHGGPIHSVTGSDFATLVAQSSGRVHGLVVPNDQSSKSLGNDPLAAAGGSAQKPGPAAVGKKP